MIAAASFLYIQSTLQSPPKNSSPTSVIFHIPIPPLLFHKIILIIPTNSPFLYTSAIFHLPLLTQNMDSDNMAHNQPQKIGDLQVCQTIQSTFSYILNRQYVITFHTLLIPPQELTFPWKQVA